MSTPLEGERPPDQRRDGDALAVDDAGRPLELAAVSDRGTVRVENQDGWAMAALRAAPGALLVVADGMGGHPDGRLAASLAVEVATNQLLDDPEPGDALPAAVEAANNAIAERAVPDERGRSLGTTLVAAVVSGGRATVANVGDSRAYLVRGGTALQVTVDHSWVAEQVRAGLLTPEEAQRHPRRSRITRALLGQPIIPDVFEVTLRPGDCLLLCTDGLWESLTPDRVGRLDPEAPLDELVAMLCDDALRFGSSDNVTAVACRVAREPAAE